MTIGKGGGPPLLLLQAMDSRQKKTYTASLVSLIGNAILAAMKIGIGVHSKSLAVVGDGVDSSIDVLISVVAVFTARLIAKPPNKKFAYGYEKADSIAAKVLSMFVFYAGVQLALTTIKKLIFNEDLAIPSHAAIYVTLFSIVGKIVLSIYQFAMGKKNNSTMLIANAKNMKYDVAISCAVLVGLLCTKIFSMPVIDVVAALAVSLWVIKGSISIFIETSNTLMDGVKDCSVYDKIFEAVEEVKGAINPHNVRTRQIGHLYSIVIDIEADGNLSLRNAHEIAKQVEDKIREKVENIYDIVIHIDPIGLEEKDAAFGISKNME